MPYCFRIHCILGTTVTIQSDEPRWTLATREEHGYDVYLAPADGETIGATREIVVRGEAFGNDDAALAAGHKWLPRIQVAFARMHIGADFGERGVGSGIFLPAGIEMLEAQYQARVLNDELGLSVFDREPAPVFVRMPSPTVSVGKVNVLSALRAASRIDVSLTQQEQLAYALYGASFNEIHADGRFIMLMMALETLLPEIERPPEVLAHIETLAALTESADISDHDRRSLMGSLRWLRLQSVNQSGRQLSLRLGDRTYMDGQPGGPETARKFFTRCYEMRSALVHGHFPRPTRQDVGVRAAHLEDFVGDLLAGPLLNADMPLGGAEP